jgi:hypothetical protein
MNRLALAFVVALTFAAPSASARAPRCDGDFQLVRGSWVSTPYCRASQIAIAARDAGIHVSPEAILAHPSRGDELCRFLDADYRVHPACEELHSIFQLAF